jgi:glycosyltransferase involved in cell wall biosynthesis
MSLLEAMALARPVVTTDVGGTPDLVVNGETGFLVPPGDRAAIERALLELAANRSRADAMGAAARRLQRARFTGERMVDGYESTFEKAIGRGQT